MNDINHQAIKGTTAVAAAGIAGYTWNEVAAILSALYASILIGEWVWKRIIKPMALTRGWIRPKTIWVESR